MGSAVQATEENNALLAALNDDDVTRQPKAFQFIRIQRARGKALRIRYKKAHRSCSVEEDRVK